MKTLERRQSADDFESRAVIFADSFGRAAATRQLDVSVKTLANVDRECPNG